MAIKARASITLSFMVDVKATYRYYKLQASTALAPTAPTAYPPSNWTDTEPSYTSGSTNTLYFVDLTVFTNDTWLYSAVSKSSSYEAAKEAYNKAVAAKSAADAAIKTSETLYYASKSGTSYPSKPTADVTTSSESTYAAWNKTLPTYSSTYPYLYICTQNLTNGGTYSWTNVEPSAYSDFVDTTKSTADTANKRATYIYGTCSTAAGTAAKVATLSNFSLYTNATVHIKFTNNNTVDAPTLNVNSTGAKSIVTNGVKYAYWEAGATVTFSYDGTNWNVASVPVYANTATIGNPSSQNVYIDSDSVDIRNGTTVNASFSENLIELGKNSNEAKIDLCAGNGEIGYNSAEDWSLKGIYVRTGYDVDSTNRHNYAVLDNTVGANQAQLELEACAGSNTNGIKSAKIQTYAYDTYSSISLTADEININASQLSDFVIVQGTSGKWTYRKWNSGTAECWYSDPSNVSITIPGAWNIVGAVSLGSFSLPFTFASVPKVVATYWTNAFLGEASIGKITTTSVDLYLSTGTTTSGTYTMRKNIHVCGRWK